MRPFFDFSTRNLPGQQQFTQSIVNQFNEEERQWEKKYYRCTLRAFILLLGALQQKRN